MSHGNERFLHLKMRETVNLKRSKKGGRGNGNNKRKPVVVVYLIYIQHHVSFTVYLSKRVHMMHRWKGRGQGVAGMKVDGRGDGWWWWWWSIFEETRRVGKKELRSTDIIIYVSLSLSFLFLLSLYLFFPSFAFNLFLFLIHASIHTLS